MFLGWLNLVAGAAGAYFLGLGTFVTATVVIVGVVQLVMVYALAAIVNNTHRTSANTYQTNLLLQELVENSR